MRSKLTLTQQKWILPRGISDTSAPFPALGLFWDGSTVAMSVVWLSRDTSALLSPVLLNWPDEPQCLALSVKLLLLLINHTSCCRCRYIFIRGTQLYFRPYALLTVYQINWVNVLLRGQRGACNMSDMDMSVWKKKTGYNRSKVINLLNQLWY